MKKLFFSLGKRAIQFANKIPSYVVSHNEKAVRKDYYKKNRNVVKSVNWSKEESKILSDYWEHYGFDRIDEKGFMYFKSVSGVFNPKYVTNMIYDTVVERRLNPYHYSMMLQKKELSGFLFSGIDGLYLPKTFLTVTHNHEFICNDAFVDRDEAISRCSNLGKIICKPTIGTSRGVSIKSIVVKDGIDTISKKSFSDILDEYNNMDLLIQEWVYPSDELKKLYPHSLGTFRVTTYLLNGKAYCGPITLRQSVGNTEIDGVNCRGYTIGLNKETGKLLKTGYFYDESNQYKLYEHPDTRIKFEDYYVGNIQKMIDVALKMHSRIPDIGIASWDLSFAQDGDIVFIEVNLLYQGVDINQIANGTPLFEENSDEMLKKIFSIK